MATQILDARQIFLEAVEKHAPQEWPGYLDVACGGDSALRERVEELLAAHGRYNAMLDGSGLLATVDNPLPERLGMQIGPYKLLQQIGEGGFGVVFMAEQVEPVRRRVALKVIKPGMDTRQVIARFDAERQALAVMDHPNIARVLDAGATESGRPYFVMELVRGTPITAYCDENNVPIRDRLALFASVCQAIQHAHTKGIIHRDIKPSNVLVTRQDGQAVVKVIDFGIAKAMGQQLTDKTLFTEFAQMVGTPLYMSPEQAELSSTDIDTRSDIYSLGVLLYELLTGSTPVSKEQLKQAAFDEIRRIIREDEPPKPSTRISTAEAAPSIAAQRHTEPAKLARLVRGELDWIVMKALEKERSRRYETASGFAADVQRYLADEPVQACPPSAGYRLRKFVRRNKAVLATVSAIAAALLIGIAVSTWQAIRATRAENLAWQRLQNEKRATEKAIVARQEADQQRTKAQENAAEAQAQRRIAEENFARAKAAVENYFVQVSESHLLKAAGLQPLRRELLAAALSFYEELTKQRSNDPALAAELAGAHYRVGRIHSELGAKDDAQKAYAKGQELYEALLKARPENVELLHGLARCKFWRGQTTEAIAAWEKLAEKSPVHADIRRELASAYNSVANGARDGGRAAEALPWHRKALAIREQLAAAAPEDAEARYALGQTLNNLNNIALQLGGRDADALAMYRRALEHGQFAYDRAPQNVDYGRLVGWAEGNIGFCESRLGSQKPALESFQKAIGIWKKLALDNPAVPDLHANLLASYRRLAYYQRDLGQIEEWTRTMRLSQQVLERFPQQSATDLYNLACMHAVTAALSAKDPLTTPVPELLEAQKEVERELQDAVDALDRAIQAGFTDLALLQTDTDLDALRARDDFRKVAARLDDTLKSQQVAQAEKERGAKFEALAKSAAQGATPESLQAGQALLAIRQSLADEKPEQLDRRADVAAAQHAIGLIQLSLGQLDDAAMSLAQAEATRQGLVTAEPNNRSYQADLAATRLALGDLDWKAGRLAEGAARWDEALAMLEALVAAEPQSARFVSELAAAAAAIGNHYSEILLWQEAAGYYAKAFAAQPSGNSYNWVPVGYFSFFAGDRDAYRRLCTQALERSQGNVDRRMISDLIGCICLSPEPHIESSKLVELARQVLAVEATAGYRRYRVALAHYRAGQDAEALKILEGYRGVSESWPIVAMIYQRMGQPEQARLELAKCDRQVERWLHQLLAAESLQVTPGPDWLFTQILRREAHALVDGRPFDFGPLEHLLWARAYDRVGQKEKAEAEFQAAVNASTTDRQTLLTQIAVLERLGRHDDVDRVFERAAALSPGDSGPWIARARQFAQRGERERAEALFAKAATVAPDELNRFLEAGWWAAAEPVGEGPLAPAGEGAARTWHQVPTADWGRLDIQSVAAVKALPTAYAVNYVYSPDLRSVTLLVGSADRVRLELNGELVHDAVGRTWEWGQLKVPVLLRPGRNTFVATIFKPDHYHAFMLRIADSPFDRGYLLAQLGLWDEALALWTPELAARPREAPWLWQHYAGMLLLQGQTEAYRQVCSQMLERPGPDNWERNRIPVACALAPLEADEAARLVKLIDANSTSDGGTEWNRFIKSLVYYRAKRYQEVLPLLDYPRSKPDWLEGDRFALRALCQHALGNAAAAQAELKKADDWGAALFQPASAGRPWAPTLSKHNGVVEPVTFYILSREAHRLIAGDAPPHDRDLADLAAAVRTYLQSSDPLTAAFDRAILVEPHNARHWLGRYRARAAAGQTEQAERELEQLVRNAPSQPDGWKIRGELYATLGRHDQAAADFAKALALMPTSDNRLGGPRRLLCAHLAQWPGVFSGVQSQLGNDDSFWMGRALWHAQHSRWREAADDFARTNEAKLYSEDFLCYAGCRLLAGQAGNYKDLCLRYAQRNQKAADTGASPWVAQNLSRACTLSADMPAEPSQVLAWAEAGASISAGRSPLALGLAYYRAGDWERAVSALNESVRTWQNGKHPVEKHQAELALAMCEFHLGAADQARQRLKTTCELMDQTIPYTTDNPIAVLPQNWITLNILRREAEGVIGGAK